MDERYTHPCWLASHWQHPSPKESPLKAISHCPRLILPLTIVCVPAQFRYELTDLDFVRFMRPFRVGASTPQCIKEARVA